MIVKKTWLKMKTDNEYALEAKMYSELMRRKCWEYTGYFLLGFIPLYIRRK